MRKTIAFTVGLLIWGCGDDPALGGQESLIGGTPQDPKDFAANVYSTHGSARCTSTVIGPRALLTAAHCVSSTSETSFTADGDRYKATCTAAPGYLRGNSTADWALCLIDREVEGVDYEVIGQSAKVKVGEQLLLTGYGCTSDPRVGKAGGNDGLFRIGHAKVVQVPTRPRNNDIITMGKGALCPGDSGSSAYQELEGQRTVVGVNSRGNFRDTSYVVSIATDEAKAFFSQWALRNRAKICGIHSNVANCRQ